MIRAISSLAQRTMFSLLMLFAFTAFAQDVPLAPKNFSVAVNGTTVYAMWQKNNDGPAAEGYKVYVAKGQTEDLSAFDLVGTVTQPIEGEKYKFAIEKLGPGTYTVIVRAFNGSGEGNRTMIKVVTIKENTEGNGIVFKTTPKKEVGENSEYVYEAVAKYAKDPNAVIRYRLDCDAPDGLELNPETGRIFWRTGKAGVYKICLVAYLESNNEIIAKQYFEVRVGAASGDGIVFKTTPKKEAAENSEYIYEAVAKYMKDPNAVIRYRLDCDAPAGLELNPETGRIFWRTGAAGVYKICLVAYLESNNEVIAKQYFELKVGGSNAEDGLVFISKPTRNPELGKEWVYEAKAVYKKDQSVTVRYSLKNAPDGMTIDENTGRIVWTPGKEGVYEFAVMATITIDGVEKTVKQELRFKIGNDGKEEDLQPCSIIFGKVAFENGEKTKAGIVTLIRVDGAGRGKYIAKIVEGNFELKVPEGVYTILVSGENFVSEFYNDAATIEKAERITIGCDVEKEINFVVNEKAVPKRKIISGMITNSKGEGVICYVDVIDRNAKAENGKEVHYTGKTGEKGGYEIAVPEGATVIVLAKAAKSDDYMPTFAESTTNMNDAKSFVMNENVTANITLIDRVPFNNVVKGFVRASESADTRIAGKVTLMNVKENGDGKGRFRTIETDDQGNYTFANILPGTYVIQAIPFSKTYRPGYYKANGEVVTEWKNAEQITVTENSEAVNLAIVLGLSQGKKGVAKINGNVRKGKGSIKVDEVQSADFVSGTVIVATDAYGNVTDWAVSDDLGNYNLSELNQGTYTLSTDRIDFNSAQVAVQTDYTSRSTVQTDINIAALTTTSAEDMYESSNSTFVYPNPASNVVNVQFEGEGPVAELSIVNSLGTTVVTINVPVSKGTVVVPMSIDNLSTGRYFVRIQQGVERSQSVLTIQR